MQNISLNHGFDQFGEASIGLLGFLEVAFSFYTTREPVGKKKVEGKGEGCVDCLEMITEFHVGQVLYKMPVPQGDSKLKQMHVTKTGKTCRRTSSLHCTFLKK